MVLPARQNVFLRQRTFFSVTDETLHDRSHQMDSERPAVDTSSPSPAGSSGLFSLKYLSLIVLTVQNAFLILIIRYSRTIEEGQMYIASTAGVMAELFMMVASLIFILAEHKGNVVHWASFLYQSIIGNPLDTLKINVPALIYTVQNNLQYVAISNLDAATFQVMYPLKILTTAVFSVIMLKKTLHCTQWLALIMLFVGVATVQLQHGNGNTKPTSSPVEGNVRKQYPMVGLLAVITSSLCLGFARVYIEKILKGSKSSICLINVQSGMYGMAIGLLGMWFKDGEKVKESGFFTGYTSLVWLVIFNQAFGGLLVAVVVKYADNILKGFATSLAIIISCFMSVYFFSFQLNLLFIAGAALVISAVFIYGKAGMTVATQQNGAVLPVQR